MEEADQQPQPDVESRQRKAENQSAVLDALSAHIALIDGEGVILAVNASWRRFASSNKLRGPDAGVGLNYIEACERARGDCAEEALAAADGIRHVLRGESAEFELEYPCHSASEQRWFRLVVTPLAGTPNADAVVMHTNITERKLAELRIKEIEERYRALFERSLDGLYLHDLEGRFLDANPAALNLLGYMREDIRSLDFASVLADQQDLSHAREATRRLIETGTQTEVSEYRLRRKDGKQVWVELSSSPILEQGRPVAVQGVARDITARKQAEEELAASEERFRTFFESAAIGLAIVDYRDGRIQQCNQALSRMFGYTVAELCEMKVEDISHPEDQVRDLAYGQEMLEGRRDHFQMEKRYRRKQGDWMWGLLTATLVRTRDGEPHFIIGMVEDITARRRAEESLRESEQRFRGVFDSAATGIAITTSEGRFTRANPAYCRMLGYTEEELQSLDFISLTHPDDRSRNLQQTEEILSGARENYLIKKRYLKKNGETVWAQTSVSAMRNAAGQVTGLIGVAEDITEQMRAEERIAEQAALIDHARDAIHVRDLEHRIIFWSKGAQRIFGWTSEEAQGQPVDTLLQAEPARFQEACTAVLEQGVWSGQLEKSDRKGNRLTLDCRWTLLKDAEGKPRSILTIETDITQNKRLEQQFLRAQRMESIGTLAGGIAHDLNNVLAPIMMSIELLKLDEQDREKLGLLSTIESSAQRGADMVRQVLSFARGVEGRRIEVQVRHLVRDIEKIARDTFPKNIQTRLMLPSKLPLVIGDPTQLHQVLMNLAINARDAMPGGGTLTLSVEDVKLDEQYAGLDPEARPGRYLVIRVEDTGTGMPPEVVERIFDPFFTTKELGKGTGLGLSTSLAIVKSHSGFFRIQSEPGRGTQFSVYLPAQTQSSSDTEQLLAADLPRGNGELILVVDDEEGVRQVTRQTLESFGYQVVVAGDGAEAVTLYMQHKQEVAVVLTDMMMPVMDGRATIQVLLRMNPRLRIIAASGLGAGDKAIRAAHAGIRHFLPKPYTAETLLKAMRNVIDEPQSSEA